MGDLARTGFKALPARANTDEMLRYANHSPFNQFPVVQEDGRLVGMVRLRDLSDIVYDPQAADLVIAADVVSVLPSEACLAAGAPAVEAAAFFERYPGNTVPVVDRTDTLKYVGVLERAEVLRVMRHIQRDSVPPPAG